MATADTPEGYRWWSYDAFGRQVSVGYWQSADSIPVSYAKNATFNAAGQLTSYELDPSLCRGLSIYSATRGISLSYNALGQLTSQTSVTLSDSYTYSATANDGRILGRTVYTPFFQSLLSKITSALPSWTGRSRATPRLAGPRCPRNEPDSGI